MTKRTGHIESVESDETPFAVAFEDGEVVTTLVLPKGQSALEHLIESGIVTATDSAIAWRTGHLEHIARVYVADPKLAWRDYADDLTVALAADGSNFAAAVEAARGE